MTKYLKQLLVIIFLLIFNSSFAQISEQQPDRDSIAKALLPIPGRAIVFVVRPTSFASLIRMDVNCDTTYIGTTGPKRYVYTVLPPGKYTFLSRSQNKSFLEITVEAGKIYYLEQQVKMGAIYARTNLKLAEEADGKKFLAKCKLDHTNQYTH